MKKNISLKFIIVISVIFCLVIAGIFLYNNVGPGKAYFIISDKDINSPADAQNSETINQDSKVYFYLSYKKKALDARVCVLEIEFENKGEYKFYKKIMYEIDRDFPKLSSYIPPEYFKKRAGNYKIKAYLDGKLISSRVVEVIK